jgi:hypothetical protein
MGRKEIMKLWDAVAGSTKRLEDFKAEQRIQNDKVLDLLCHPHKFDYVGEVDGVRPYTRVQRFECLSCGRVRDFYIKELTDELIASIIAKRPEHYTTYLKDRYEAVRKAREAFDVEL